MLRQHEHVAFARRVQLHRAVGERQHAAHALAAREDLDQLGQARRLGDRLEHELQRAAAGQAEARGLLGADAVAHDFRPREREGAQAHLVDEVVLDAAAGDGAGDLAVAAHGHEGTHRARRRAPGAHHGAEHHPVPGRAPADDLLQDAEVDVVHLSSPPPRSATPRA